MGLIKGNLKLKFMALAIATALWFFVAWQSNTEVGFLIPLGYSRMPNDMVVTGNPLSEIDVRVTGPRLAVERMKVSDLVAEIDLASAVEGVNTYKLAPHNVTAPLGVSVKRVMPGTVDVRLERLREALVRVNVRLEGVVASGYAVRGVEVFPARVKVMAPGKDAAGSAIFTRPVNVSGLSSDVTLTAPLDVGGFKSVDEDRVKVKITISREKRGGE